MGMYHRGLQVLVAQQFLEFLDRPNVLTVLYDGLTGSDVDLVYSFRLE